MCVCVYLNVYMPVSVPICQVSKKVRRGFQILKLEFQVFMSWPIKILGTEHEYPKHTLQVHQALLSVAIFRALDCVCVKMHFRTGEMPQSVNSWPYKYENQSLDAQNPWKKKGTVAFAYNSSGTETRASLEIIGHLAN